MVHILLIHGPNLNMLGLREPNVYGSTTLDQLNENMTKLAKQIGVSLISLQSNNEGEIIDSIHKAMNNVDGLIINPGGLTHTSVCLRDALLATSLPFVEVHMTNIAAREQFRHHSFLSSIAIGTIAGFGVDSYYLGLRALCSVLTRP